MQITATNVEKRYGDVTALAGLSLSTYGILGTNGAGKTTLFKLLVGHDTPDSGQLSVGGHPVSTAGYRIREQVGYLPEHVGFPGRLTGREILHFHAEMRGLPADNRIQQTADTVGLADAIDRAVSGYSNGMRRRLGLATVLLAEPSVLILDEPTAGLDPCGVREFHTLIEAIQDDTDATVVVCSHVLPDVEQLCDRAAVLHDGQILASGSISTLVSELGTSDPNQGLETVFHTAVSDARSAQEVAE